MRWDGFVAVYPRLLARTHANTQAGHRGRDESVAAIASVQRDRECLGGIDGDNERLHCMEPPALPAIT